MSNKDLQLRFLIDGLLPQLGVAVITGDATYARLIAADIAFNVMRADGDARWGGRLIEKSDEAEIGISPAAIVRDAASGTPEHFASLARELGCCVLLTGANDEFVRAADVAIDVRRWAVEGGGQLGAVSLNPPRVLGRWKYDVEEHMPVEPDAQVIRDVREIDLRAAA